MRVAIVSTSRKKEREREREKRCTHLQTWLRAPGCRRVANVNIKKRLLTHIHAQAVRRGHSIMARCRKAGSAGVGRGGWAQPGAGNGGLGANEHGLSECSVLPRLR